MDRAFAEAAAALGSVDISVACVGGGGTVDGKPVSTAGRAYTVASHSTEDYVGIVKLTQFATFFTCRAAAQVIPHHETFSTTIQPPYSSTKG